MKNNEKRKGYTEEEKKRAKELMDLYLRKSYSRPASALLNCIFYTQLEVHSRKISRNQFFVK